MFLIFESYVAEMFIFVPKKEKEKTYKQITMRRKARWTFMQADAVDVLFLIIFSSLYYKMMGDKGELLLSVGKSVKRT